MPDWRSAGIGGLFAAIGHHTPVYALGPEVAELEDLLNGMDEFLNVVRRSLEVEEVAVDNCLGLGLK